MNIVGLSGRTLSVDTQLGQDSRFQTHVPLLIVDADKGKGQLTPSTTARAMVALAVSIHLAALEGCLSSSRNKGATGLIAVTGAQGYVLHSPSFWALAIIAFGVVFFMSSGNPDRTFGLSCCQIKKGTLLCALPFWQTCVTPYCKLATISTRRCVRS